MGTSQQAMNAQHEVSAGTFLPDDAENARKLHATDCPVTANVTYAETCHETGSVPVDDRTLVTSANIRQRRQELHLTQEQVAQRTGKSRREIIRWEKNVTPGHANMIVLAEALECDPFWFYVPHDGAEDAELAS
jgi:DNA-binding XRE family transcriptional regulator